MAGVCVTAASDLRYSASWMIIYNSSVVMGDTYMKCEQSISRRGEGKRSGWWKVRRGRSTTDRNTKRGGGGRTGSEEVWKGGRESESDESFFQVVCSPEATVDPDGLRLRGNRMCINIYSPPFTFFPTKTGERKSASPGTHLYASHRTGAYSLMPRRVHVWGLL